MGGLVFRPEMPYRREHKTIRVIFDRNEHPPCHAWVETDAGWRQLVNPKKFVCHITAGRQLTMERLREDRE